MPKLKQADIKAVIQEISNLAAAKQDLKGVAKISKHLEKMAAKGDMTAVEQAIHLKKALAYVAMQKRITVKAKAVFEEIGAGIEILIEGVLRLEKKQMAKIKVSLNSLSTAKENKKNVSNVIEVLRELDKLVGKFSYKNLDSTDKILVVEVLQSLGLPDPSVAAQRPNLLLGQYFQRMIATLDVPKSVVKRDPVTKAELAAAKAALGFTTHNRRVKLTVPPKPQQSKTVANNKRAKLANAVKSKVPPPAMTKYVKNIQARTATTSSIKETVKTYTESLKAQIKYFPQVLQDGIIKSWAKAVSVEKELSAKKAGEILNKYLKAVVAIDESESLRASLIKIFAFISRKDILKDEKLARFFSNIGHSVIEVIIDHCYEPKTLEAEVKVALSKKLTDVNDFSPALVEAYQELYQEARPIPTSGRLRSRRSPEEDFAMKVPAMEALLKKLAGGKSLRDYPNQGKIAKVSDVLIILKAMVGSEKFGTLGRAQQTDLCAILRMIGVNSSKVRLYTMTPLANRFDAIMKMLPASEGSGPPPAVEPPHPVH